MKNVFDSYITIKKTIFPAFQVINPANKTPINENKQKHNELVTICVHNFIFFYKQILFFNWVSMILQHFILQMTNMIILSIHPFSELVNQF